MFEDLIEEVVYWNEICRDTPPTEEEQLRIVQEEINELNEAVRFNSGANELKEVADVFFTGAYMEYLYPSHPIVSRCKKEIDDALVIYGEDLLRDVIQEVINSNYSKFIDNYRYTEVVEEVKKLSPFLTIRRRGEYCVVFDENNKVKKLKAFYKEANIQEILNKHKGVK